MNMEINLWIRSYIDGRIRIRNPLLKKLDVTTVTTFKEKALCIKGIQTLEINPKVGSLLLLWDKHQLTRQEIENYLVLWFSTIQTQTSIPSRTVTNISSKKMDTNCQDARNTIQKIYEKSMDCIAPIMAPNSGSLRRSRRVAQNRLMLGLATASIASIALNTRWHATLGYAFSAFLVIHLYQHRRVL